MATARLSRSEPLVDRAMAPALAVLAFSQLVLAVWMVADPASFFDHVGGFGARNDHYLRDVATFEAALGVCAAVAVRRPSWRVAVLAFATVQFALHAINHIADAHAAVASTSGWADAIEIAVGAVLLGWLLRGAIHAERRRG